MKECGEGRKGFTRKHHQKQTWRNVGRKGSASLENTTKTPSETNMEEYGEGRKCFTRKHIRKHHQKQTWRNVGREGSASLENAKCLGGKEMLHQKTETNMEEYAGGKKVLH